MHYLPDEPLTSKIELGMHFLERKWRIFNKCEGLDYWKGTEGFGDKAPQRPCLQTSTEHDAYPNEAF